MEATSLALSLSVLFLIFGDTISFSLWSEL